MPQQTLFALNSDFVQDRAKALVDLPEIREATSDEERVRRLYRRLYGRSPDPEEIGLAIAYLGESPDSTSAWSRLAHALLAANEFHFID